MRTFKFAAALALSGPAMAAGQGADAAKITIELSSHSFTPKQIHLRAGKPVILHLINKASKTHTFAAPEFFAVATMQSKMQIPGGDVRLAEGETRDIALVPKAGRYKLKCTRPFHKALGMSGEIIVE